MIDGIDLERHYAVQSCAVQSCRPASASALRSLRELFDHNVPISRGENGGNTVLSRRSEITVADDRSGLFGEISIDKLVAR